MWQLFHTLSKLHHEERLSVVIILCHPVKDILLSVSISWVDIMIYFYCHLIEWGRAHITAIYCGKVSFLHLWCYDAFHLIIDEVEFSLFDLPLSMMVDWKGIVYLDLMRLIQQSFKSSCSYWVYQLTWIWLKKLFVLDNLASFFIIWHTFTTLNASIKHMCR